MAQALYSESKKPVGYYEARNDLRGLYDPMYAFKPEVGRKKIIWERLYETSAARIGNFNPHGKGHTRETHDMTFAGYAAPKVWQPDYNTSNARNGSKLDPETGLSHLNDYNNLAAFAKLKTAGSWGATMTENEKVFRQRLQNRPCKFNMPSKRHFPRHTFLNCQPIDTLKDSEWRAGRCVYSLVPPPPEHKEPGYLHRIKLAKKYHDTIPIVHTEMRFPLGEYESKPFGAEQVSMYSNHNLPRPSQTSMYDGIKDLGHPYYTCVKNFSRF